MLPRKLMATRASLSRLAGTLLILSLHLGPVSAAANGRTAAKAAVEFGWFGSSPPFDATATTLTSAELSSVVRQSPVLASLGESESVLSFVSWLLHKWFDPREVDSAPFQLKQDGYQSTQRGIRVSMRKVTVLARCSDTECVSGSLIGVGQLPESIDTSSRWVPLLLMQTLERSTGQLSQADAATEAPGSSSASTLTPLPAILVSTLVPGPLADIALTQANEGASSFPVVGDIGPAACHWDSVIATARPDDLERGAVDASCVKMNAKGPAGSGGGAAWPTVLVLNTNKLNDAASRFFNASLDLEMSPTDERCVPDIYMQASKKKWETQLSYRVPQSVTQIHLIIPAFCWPPFNAGRTRRGNFARELVLYCYHQVNLPRTKEPGPSWSPNAIKNATAQFWECINREGPVRFPNDWANFTNGDANIQTFSCSYTLADTEGLTSPQVRLLAAGREDVDGNEGLAASFYRGIISNAIWTTLQGPIVIRSLPQNSSRKSSGPPAAASASATATDTASAAASSKEPFLAQPRPLLGSRCFRQWYYDLAGSAGPDLEVPECSGGPGPRTQYLDFTLGQVTPGGAKTNGTLQWSVRCEARAQEFAFMIGSVEAALAGDVLRVIDEFGALYGTAVTRQALMQALFLALLGSVVSAGGFLPLAAAASKHLVGGFSAKVGQRVNVIHLFTAATFVVVMGAALGSAVPLVTAFITQGTRAAHTRVFDIRSQVVLVSSSGLKYVAHSYIEADVVDEKLTLALVLLAFLVIVVVTSICVVGLIWMSLRNANNKIATLKSGRSTLDKRKLLMAQVVHELYHTPASRSLSEAVEIIAKKPVPELLSHRMAMKPVPEPVSQRLEEGEEEAQPLSPSGPEFYSDKARTASEGLTHSGGFAN